jgi:NAD(P)H-dependent FMN reductase
MTELSRPLFIPVILGTVRKGRMSEFAAKSVHSELSRRPNVETELIDIRSVPLPVNDAGEAIKDANFASKMNRADGLARIQPRLRGTSEAPS